MRVYRLVGATVHAVCLHRRGPRRREYRHAHKGPIGMARGELVGGLRGPRGGHQGEGGGVEREPRRLPGLGLRV